MVDKNYSNYLLKVCDAKTTPYDHYSRSFKKSSDTSKICNEEIENKQNNKDKGSQTKPSATERLVGRVSNELK